MAADVAVFVNPAARKGRGAAGARTALEALRRRAGEHRVEVRDTVSAADVVAQARRAVEAGTGRLVVIGGDGLAHHVAQAVAGTESVLGIVPVGSGNDLALALGLPRRPDEAAAVALGPDRRIDLLRRDGRWALTVATTGFSALVNERAEAMSRPRGGARYTVATMAELPGLRATRLRITVEDPVGAVPGGPLDTVLVAVGNTARFGGGMRICPAADPADGLLEVTVIGAVGRARLLCHFARVFRGTHVHHPAVSVYRGRAVTIEPVEPAGPGGALDPSAGAVADGGPVRADGEDWGRWPCRIETVPGALRIAAP